MIDTESHPGAYADALAPTRPSLKLMTTRELVDPRAAERVQMSHGLPTMGDARDLIGSELRRRTKTNGTK